MRSDSTDARTADGPTNEVASEWLRGMLEPCLLALLADGEAYGYQLAARLADAGLGSVPGGSLYPALLRLEKKGWVRPQWRAGEGGPGRKYYRLTAAGRRRVADQRVGWHRFADAVTAILGPVEPS